MFKPFFRIFVVIFFPKPICNGGTIGSAMQLAKVVISLMMTKLQGLKSYAHLDHYICVLHLEFPIVLALWNIFAVMGSVSAVLPTGRQDFTDYFTVGWANNHVTLLDNGTCVQLKLDNQSGKALHHLPVQLNFCP